MSRAQPEKHTQLQIIKYLRLRGFAVGKIKTTGAKKGNVFLYDPYQFRGVADLMAFVPRLVFIEVKHGKNKLSTEQMIFQSLCKSALIPYLVVYSLEELIEKIDTFT